jgi:ribosomal protein L11 methyltransferase
MEWLEATIHTATTGIDMLTGVLMDHGIECFEIEDKEDFAAFLKDTEIYWDYVDEDLVKERSKGETKLKIYMPECLQSHETLQLLKEALKQLHQQDSQGLYGTLQLEISSVHQEDWENNWKQYFKPFTVGDRFVIKPSWETYDQDTDRMILEIDPASSFGTGSHETTQLCMCQLEKYIQGGEKLLDMGVGSGILSIAAHMLGAQDLTAVDIDANCLKTAAENGEKNHTQMKTFCGDIVKDAKLREEIGTGFDVIVANIVADVIIAMAPIFRDRLKQGGILITSGIIEGRADEVAAALQAAGFTILERHQRSDWNEITAKA